MDRARNRAGILEGPIFAFQARHETNFSGEGAEGKASNCRGSGKLDRTDILREVGALLVLAQERAREGKPEVVPGKGKWWAEKARWGGGSGEAVGKPLQEDDESVPMEVTDEMAARAKAVFNPPPTPLPIEHRGIFRPARDSFDPQGRRDDDGRLAKRRSVGTAATMATYAAVVKERKDTKETKEERAEAREKAKKLHMRRRMIAQSYEMPNPLWDKRVEYRMIGKRKEHVYDEVSPPFFTVPLLLTLSIPLAKAMMAARRTS